MDEKGPEMEAPSGPGWDVGTGFVAGLFCEGFRIRAIKELMSMAGRTVLVSGGAGKLGSAIATALAELGAGIVIVDEDEAGSSRLVDEIRGQYSVPAITIPADLQNIGAVQALPTQICDQMGGLNVVVNCAGVVGTAALPGWSVPFEHQSLEAWRLALEVNLTAPFVLTQAAVPFLRQSGHASIINIGSIYGMVGPDWRLYEGTPLGNPAGYAASKGGLLQFTRWLATTLAPEIRVNSVSPGGIFRAHSEPFFSRYVSRTPMKRMATEEDVVGGVAYLASDLSAYVTGQNLAIDGAWTVW